MTVLIVYLHQHLDVGGQSDGYDLAATDFQAVIVKVIGRKESLIRNPGIDATGMLHIAARIFTASRIILFAVSSVDQSTHN